MRDGRYGPYVTEDAPEGEKARTASLFKSMSPDTVTLDEAVQLLTLPRTLGESDGEEVIAANGRYGPYVKKGAETRSIAGEEALLTITLDDALTLLAQPRTGGRRAAAPPLRELAADPVSGKPIVVKEGRFGPYVTDGETNASLRAGDTVEEITNERAAELLQLRRDRGPAKAKGKRTKRSRIVALSGDFRRKMARFGETLVTSERPYCGGASRAGAVGVLQRGVARRLLPSAPERARPSGTVVSEVVWWESLHGRFASAGAETKGHRVPLDSEPADRVA